jgi:hypothetical protein
MGTHNFKNIGLNQYLPKVEIEEFKLPDIRNYQLADYQYELIMESIKSFESKLDDNQELAVKLASFGQSILLTVTDIGYSNPTLIRFYGYVNGQESELIQHISQLNFLLTSVQKNDSSRPARRIGFDNGSND